MILVASPPFCITQEENVWLLAIVKLVCGGYRKVFLYIGILPGSQKDHLRTFLKLSCLLLLMSLDSPFHQPYVPSLSLPEVLFRLPTNMWIQREEPTTQRFKQERSEALLVERFSLGMWSTKKTRTGPQLPTVWWLLFILIAKTCSPVLQPCSAWGHGSKQFYLHSHAVWNLRLTFAKLQAVMVTIISSQVAVCPVGPAGWGWGDIST